MPESLISLTNSLIELRNSQCPRDRIFYARAVKELIMMFSPFPEVKKEVDELTKHLRNYEIYGEVYKETISCLKANKNL